MAEKCVGGAAAMIRVNVVAEGQSEMFFAKGPLNRHFGGNPILDSRCVLTSRINQSNFEFRGGLNSYLQAKNDIIAWLKQDPTAYVTTMFDFFQLPNDFPAYQQASQCQTHLDSVHMLEKAMTADITQSLPNDTVEHRFIPYIQLHEFETLLFTDVQVLKYEYCNPDDIIRINQLYESTKNIPPEDINHGEETAPSKRLLAAVDYKKGKLPSDLLEAITIKAIRQKCSHFSEWLDRLQALAGA